MSFRGFPREAVAFYAGLEADNSKAYWQAHKATYDAAVREPMEALLAEVEAEFGRGSLFRPYRDTRFSHDKSPYKTQAGAAVGERRDAVYYVQLSADGLMVAAGAHDMAPDQVARYRDAVGPELEAMVASLEKQRYEIGGESLKTVPRGFPKDHPQARLLRHRSLYAWRDFGTPGWLHTRKALDRVVATWRELAPLDAWLAAHVGPPG